MEEYKAVLNAYWLYKDKLIDKNIFYDTIEKIIQNTTTYTTPTTYTITLGQKNYISRLKMEGKIPQSQTLELSKEEAQILIHNALENKIRNPNPNGNSEPEVPDETKGLMDMENQDDY